MRTKDELFREALRHIAARRQQAVTAAERDRAAALAAHPELRAAEDARTHAGLTLTLAAAAARTTAAAAAAAESGRRALDSCLCHAGPWAGGFCSALHLPHLQGYRHGERSSLQLRGRSSPHPAAGGDQRRKPAGPVQL